MGKGSENVGGGKHDWRDGDEGCATYVSLCSVLVFQLLIHVVEVVNGAL